MQKAMEEEAMSTNFTDKQYFVIMFEAEIKKLDTEAEIAVYRAIKSYSGDGKNEVDLSVREIMQRTKLSIGTVQSTLPKLLKKGYITKVGKKARVGGKVTIYKISFENPYRVFNHRTLKTIKRSTDEQLKEESVQPLIESVQSLASNPPQSNKVNVAVSDAIKELISIKGNKASLKEGILFVNHRPVADPVAYLEAIKKAKENILPHIEASEPSSSSKDYLLNIPSTDLEEFSGRYSCNKEQVVEKGEALYNWCEAKGENRKNYKAFLVQALIKDFGKKKERGIDGKTFVYPIGKEYQQ